MGQQAGIPLWQWQISLDFLNQMQVVVFFSCLAYTIKCVSTLKYIVFETIHVIWLMMICFPRCNVFLVWFNNAFSESTECSA